MSTKHLAIISVDALNKHDYEYIQTLPNFKTFFEEGAHSKEVSSVYPTVTYTCHTSITTGHYPHAHGIFNNELPDPSKATTQDWHWFEKDIKVPTLFDYAKQANMTVATVLWPVMAGANVTYNVPEIWSPDHSISRFKLFWRYGTKNTLLQVAKYKKRLNGTKQPYLDNFSVGVTLDLIKRKPNVLAVHFTDLDTMRHIHGVHSQGATDALKRLDKRIGDIINQYKKVGLYDQTNFVLLGDHGTHDFDKIIEVNSYFRDYGLLQTNRDNEITDWKVYACTCGGSCQIHIRDDVDETIRENVRNLLYKLLEMDNSPIKQILSHTEAKETYGLDGKFDYILEAKDGHDFKNMVTGRLVYDSDEIPNVYFGDHGYLPDHKDMKTLLLMKGPSVRQGAVIEHSSLVDEGPTFAAMLGLSMEKTEGRVLTDLLN